MKVLEVMCLNKIYLLSGPLKEGGFSSCVKEDLMLDLKKLKRCVLISTKPDNYDSNDEYKERMVRDLKEVGFYGNVILLDNRISLDYAKEVLKNADFIYLLGGDPVRQLKYILENGFDEIIRNSNALVIGTSAGAMNLCCQVYCSKDEDFLESMFYKGLGLVNLIIGPHFDVSNLEQVKEIKLQSINKEIMGLLDDSAIIVEDEKIVYRGNIYLYKNGELANKKEEY